MDEPQISTNPALPTSGPQTKSALHFLLTRILIGTAMLFMVGGLGLILYGVVIHNQEATKAYAVLIGMMSVFGGLAVLLVAGLVEWLLKPKQKR